jgi:signal transduction histidine kinase
MTAVKNIFKDQLGFVRNSDFSNNTSDGQGNDLYTSTNHLSEVIENADGVPYQLIFGPKPGDGHYIYVGEGIRELLGVEPQVLTEASFHDMIEEINPLIDAIPSDFNESRKKFLNGEFQRYKVELLINTKNGVKKWVRDSSLPLIDEETGRVVGSYGILFDISDRKQAIAHLEQISAKADESDRLKTAFLNNISHEVRTPLNAIVGFSALLCEPEQGYGQKKEFINMINNSTDHFLEVMDNILEISRIEAGAVSIVMSDLNPYFLIKRVYDRFHKQADEKGLILNYQIFSGNNDLVIVTDATKVLHIMNNLLDNAIKFTSGGKIEFGYKILNKNIEFFVSDTGIGIQDHHKDYIFNKFYQAESGVSRSFSGIGLGLSISRAYVEMLGGSIGFTSKEGEGSVFSFTIPF